MMGLHLALTQLSKRCHLCCASEKGLRHRIKGLFTLKNCDMQGRSHPDSWCSSRQRLGHLPLMMVTLQPQQGAFSWELSLSPVVREGHRMSLYPFPVMQ